MFSLFRTIFLTDESWDKQQDTQGILKGDDTDKRPAAEKMIIITTWDGEGEGKKVKQRPPKASYLQITFFS